MSSNNQDTVFKNPVFLAGLAVVAVAVGCIILAAGTLISLQYTPQKLVTAFREQWVPELKGSGLSIGMIQGFLSGQVLATDDLAKLPEEERRTLVSVQKALQVFLSTTEQAVEQSRSRSQWGIGIGAVLLCLGIGLSKSGFKRVKRQQPTVSGQ